MNRNWIELVDSHVAAGEEEATGSSPFYTDPSLARCSDGSFLLCTLVDPTEKLGPDGTMRLLRSTDGLKSWQPLTSPTCHDEKADRRYGYRLCYVTETQASDLLASYVRVNRFERQEPQFHPETDGMQYSEVRLTRSCDAGRSWIEPKTLDYDLPDMIMAEGFLNLPDGALGIPCEIWHEWDRGWREWPSTRLIRSYDMGQSWPEASIIAKDEKRACIHGDPRLTILPDGRILALLWKYDLKSGRDLPIHSSQSSDNGITWSRPGSTGITGQRSHPTSLDKDRLLCVYQRRFGADAGLRAILSRDSGMTWDRDSDVSIWSVGHHTDDTNPFSGYTHSYTFGSSSSLRMSDCELLVPFWMSNGRSTYIRILHLSVA